MKKLAAAALTITMALSMSTHDKRMNGYPLPIPFFSFF